MGERDYTWKFVLMALLLAVWAWACYPLSSISQGIDLRGGAELEFTLRDPGNLDRTITRDDLNATIEVLQRRIDLLGVKEVTLEPAPPAHFRVEYPGADPKEVDNVIKTITKAGQLWFRIVQERRPGASPLPQGHRLKQWEKLVPTESDLAEVKAEMQATADRNREISRQNEVEGATKQDLIEYDRVIHWCHIPAEKAKELQKQGKKLTPEQIERTKPFRFICFNDKNRRINGKYLDTKQIYRTTSQGAPAVGFGFDGPRKKKFARLTEDNKGKPMAIVLDSVALSAPNIEERIFGSGIIHGGGMDQAEVDRLIITLKSGALPAKPRLESKNFIGPALGRDAINKGFMAIYVASALVVVFMVLYYRGSGIVAVVAILMNLIFIVGSLALLDATLTLPGIAGIILTVGMAVDANILIFERIREERLLEKSARQAMKSGYARAFWTIFDANLTTALTAFILFKVGTGPIRGFATTLLIGIIASMFTSLFCTKAIFSWLLERKWVSQFKMVHLIKKPSIVFIKFRHMAMVISLLLIVIGLFVFFKRGEEKYGIDFTGGTLFRLVFNDYESRARVEKDLSDNIPLPGIDTIEVKSVHLTAGTKADEEHAKGRAKSFVIRTRIRPNEPLAKRAEKEGEPDPGEKIWSEISEKVRENLINKKEQELEPDEQGKKKYVAADFTAGDLITATALHIFEKELALTGWPGPSEVADKREYEEQRANAKRRGRTILRVNLLRPETSPDEIVSYYKARLEEIEGGDLEELLVIDVSETGYDDDEIRKNFIQQGFPCPCPGRYRYPYIYYFPFRVPVCAGRPRSSGA
jgi:protein-export membrane protein SecD